MDPRTFVSNQRKYYPNLEEKQVELRILRRLPARKMLRFTIFFNILELYFEKFWIFLKNVEFFEILTQFKRAVMKPNLWGLLFPFKYFSEYKEEIPFVAEAPIDVAETKKQKKQKEGQTKKA